MTQPQDMSKPFSQACENNKRPIAEVLATCFDRPGRVLEIGSGTGQHALHMTQQLPHLHWQPSDREPQLAVIEQWRNEADAELLNRLLAPVALNINGPWPDYQYDYAFTANTLHIVSWPEVERLLSQLNRCLKTGGRFVIYGPFNYDGQYTTPSNAEFDGWLKQRDPRSGIRDFEAIAAQAAGLDWELLEDVAMPANNRCLVWQKK